MTNIYSFALVFFGLNWEHIITHTPMYYIDGKDHASSCIYMHTYVATYVCIYVCAYVQWYEHAMCIDIFSEENKSYKTVQYSIIVLGVLTCGTSVLLWRLFKECRSSKEKHNVKGKYTYVSA